MSGSGWRGGLADRAALTFAAAFLGLVLPARLAVAAWWTGPAGVTLGAALFVLPLLYTVPRGRAVWTRHRSWLLAAQAVLTCLPFAIFGQEWFAGLSGLLGGLLLLTVAGPVSWILFGVILAAEGVLRIVVLGVPPAAAPTLALTAWAFTIPVNMALPLFGLVRLADLVAGLHAARTQLAALAVTAERLRAASRLRAAVGDRLDAVTAHVRALEAVAHRPEQARAQLIEAAGIARQALDEVRMAVADDGQVPVTPRP